VCTNGADAAHSLAHRGFATASAPVCVVVCVCERERERVSVCVQMVLMRHTL
jgi:hypothetical protein